MHGLVTWATFENHQLRSIIIASKQHFQIQKYEPEILKEQLRKVYRQRIGVDNDSLCEMLCSLKTLLLIFGFSMSLLGFVQVLTLQTTCMNYTGIAMIWTIFEIVSYIMWLAVSFSASWQYSQRTD